VPSSTAAVGAKLWISMRHLHLHGFWTTRD